MSTDTPSDRVFLSYSTKDKPWADAALTVLESRGVKCWIAPRDIAPGTEWGASIIAGIDTCRLMVLIFSENANQSPQVHREVERAVTKRLVILPCRVEDVLPVGALEYALSNTHWLDVFTPPMEEQVERLAEAVQAVLATTQAPRAAAVAATQMPVATTERNAGEGQRSSLLSNRRDSTTASALTRTISGVLFSDVASWSELAEAQLVNFVRNVIPKFALNVIDKYREQLIELNTWGDGLLAAAQDPYCLAHLALEIQEFFKQHTWSESHLPETLSPRTALHSGVLYIGHDPIRRIDAIAGSQLLTFTASIVPVTPPGNIYATDSFFRLIDRSVDPELALDDVGEVPLARNHGIARLFRLRRDSHVSTDATRVT